VGGTPDEKSSVRTWDEAAVVMTTAARRGIKVFMGESKLSGRRRICEETRKNGLNPPGKRPFKDKD